MDPKLEARWCGEIVGYEREAKARREDGDVVGVWCYTALAARLLLALQETNSAGARRCEKQVGKTLKKLEGELKAAKNRYCERRSELLGSETGSSDQSSGDCAPLTKHEVKFVAGTKACTEYWFSRIIGLKETKSALVSGFIQPLLYPTLFDQTRAILLYGPPGTGKTLLATAAVNELAAQSGGSIEVRYFAIPPSVFRQKYVGVGEKNIETIFDCAAEVAKSRPGEPKKLAVIFIDEMEGIAGDRGKDASGTSAGPVATLLQKMEGIVSAENVVVLGATNYPWNMDSAILSRFKERILVDLPTALDLDRFINLEISKRVELVLHDKLDDTAERVQELASGGCTTEPPPLRSDSHRQATQIRVPLTPEVIQAIATQMYRRGYSMRDADSVMVKANKAMGLRAIAAGVFFKVGDKYVCKDGQTVGPKTQLYAIRGRDADYDFPGGGGVRTVALNDTVYRHRSVYIGPVFLNDDLIDDYFVGVQRSTAVPLLIKIKVRVTQSEEADEGTFEMPEGLDAALGTEPLTMDRSPKAAVQKLVAGGPKFRRMAAVIGGGTAEVDERRALGYYARGGSRVEHYYIPFVVNAAEFSAGVHTLSDLFAADKSARYAYTPWGAGVEEGGMTQVDLTKLSGKEGSRTSESVVVPNLLSLRTLKWAGLATGAGVATGGLGAVAAGAGALVGTVAARVTTERHQVDYVRLCEQIAEGTQVHDLFSIDPGLAASTGTEVQVATESDATSRAQDKNFARGVSVLPDGAPLYTFAYTQDILTEAITKVPPSYNKALHKSLLRYSIDAGLETECRAPNLGENMEKCEKAFLAKHSAKKAAVAGRSDGK